MKLDINEVMKIYYEGAVRVCPECGKHTTPLGDLGIEPYHYCFPCEKRYEWDDLPNIRINDSSTSTKIEGEQE